MNTVLLEGTQPLLWLDLIFGPTKGWWAFDDTWRKNHPLLDKSKWLEVLDVKGFEAGSISDDQVASSVFIARSRGKVEDSTKSLVCSAVDLEGDIISKLHQGVERVLDVVQKTKNHAPLAIPHNRDTGRCWRGLCIEPGSDMGIGPDGRIGMPGTSVSAH